MRASDHSPSSRTKTIVLQISKASHLVLVRASAREAVDPEVLLERLVEAEYSPDGKPEKERVRETQAREEEARSQRIRRLGLSNESDAETPSISQAREIDRYLRLAREVRD